MVLGVSRSRLLSDRRICYIYIYIVDVVWLRALVQNFTFN